MINKSDECGLTPNCIDCNKILQKEERFDYNCNHYICENCSKSNPTCSICKNTEKLRKTIDEKLIFLRLFCRFHSDKIANTIDLSSFTSYCKECNSPSSQALSSMNIHETLTQYFKENYKIFKKQFCPERRKILIQSLNQNCYSLLISCRWLYEYKTGLKCSVNLKTIHKNANYINVETLETYEKLKNSINDPNIQILNSTTKNLLISQFLLKLKNTSSEFINKFFLKLKSLESVSLELMILEGRDLWNMIKIQPRCVVCLKNSNIGSQTLIKLACQHTICFNCYMSDFIYECPIDLLQISSENLEYFDSFERILPNCHNFHSFVNCHEKVFKLSCFHFSCERCIKKNCCECGSLVEDFKVQIKIMNKIEFLTVFCKTHQVLASFFDFFGFEPHCNDCHKETDWLIKDCNINTLITMNNNCFLCYTKEILDKNYYFDKDLLKLTQYFRILDFKTQFFLASKVLKEICEITITKPSNYEVFRRFKSLFPKVVNTTKQWKIEKNSPIKVFLTVNKPVLLAGLLLAGSYHKKTHNNSINLRVFTIKRIKISYSSNILFTSKSFPLLQNQENNVLFDYCVTLEPNKKYLLKIEFSKGFYYHGRPFDRVSDVPVEVFSVVNPNSDTKTANFTIGGPILGFITKPLFSL